MRAWAATGAEPLDAAGGRAGWRADQPLGRCLRAGDAAGFPGRPQIMTQPVGGLDGVTGANRLDALVVPDGKTAAILPGAALIAWLTGDSRVHFDPTRWVPLMAGANSGVLVVRAARRRASRICRVCGPWRRCGWPRTSRRAMIWPPCWRWPGWACRRRRSSACAVRMRRPGPFWRARSMRCLSAAKACRRISRR